MKTYLKCKKANTAIDRAKQKLIKVASKSGLYENFGQTEVREIKDVFIDTCDYSDSMNKTRDLINNFDDWCSSYCISNKFIN